jgi:hypothetical protein
MRKGLVIIIALIVGYAISWAVIVGIIKLITMCFSIGFSLPVATGIWLILCLLKLVFHKSEERR